MAKDFHMRKATRSATQPDQFLDLTNGSIQGRGPLGIAFGKGLNKLLLVLLEDFYRPATIGRIFSSLYPEENYFPRETPLRIHQLIFRLRAWFQKQNLPIEIHELNGLFKVYILEGFAVKLPVGEQIYKLSSKELQLNQIRATFGLQQFNIPDVTRSLGLSAETVRLILNSGISSNRLKKTKQGKSVSYQFLT